MGNLRFLNPGNKLNSFKLFTKQSLFVWQWLPECLDVAAVLLLLLPQLALFGFAA